jgi:hypothetical protein
MQRDAGRNRDRDNFQQWPDELQLHDEGGRNVVCAGDRYGQRLYLGERPDDVQHVELTAPGRPFRQADRVFSELLGPALLGAGPSFFKGELASRVVEAWDTGKRQ